MDDLWKIAEEERHDEGGDVLTVHIGIGHDDDLVVTQFFDIGHLAFFIDTEANAERLDDVVHLVALKGFVPHGFFHIEDFTTERKDGLR